MTDYDLSEVPTGWQPLIRELLAELAKVPGWRDSYIDQIKEKFGGLRFYYSGPTPEDAPELDLDAFADAVDSLIASAEVRALATCGHCASTTAVKRQRVAGWIHTLCEPCYAAKLRGT